MKTNSSRAALFNSRVLIGFAPCSAGLLLALAGLSQSVTGISAAATVQAHGSAATFPEASASASTKLTYKIIDASKHTYGYDVFADGRLMIHQTSLPAVPGNEGFQTKNDASKVALLVIKKIKKGEMPPTIAVDEMKKLNVIK